MKKRMFITTIVMMLVLAVALTTSSLAWFSSANITVTANAATFTAATAGSSNVNLKIADTIGSWGNQISLDTQGTNRTLTPLIPTAPIISALEVGDDIVATGVSRKNGQGQDVPVPVSYKGYVWPSAIEFNGAKINGQTSKFVIDANNTVSNPTNAVNGADGYYYDSFYILNADQQNSLAQLTFNVTSSLTTIAEGQTGYDPGDYTARGYIAFIIFDLVNVEAGENIPANAASNAGKEVVEFTDDPEELAAITSSQIMELTAGAGVDVWVPFVGFTFCTDKGNSDTFTETDFQFADLDKQTTPGVYDYNDALTTSLKTQAYEKLTGEDYKLNTENLRKLNNKIVNTTAMTSGENPVADEATRGNVRNSGDGFERDGDTDKDEASVFLMNPSEIYRIDMYYWLDGSSLSELTDTTVSSIGLTISAQRQATND